MLSRADFENVLGYDGYCSYDHKTYRVTQLAVKLYDSRLPRTEADFIYVYLKEDDYDTDLCYLRMTIENMIRLTLCPRTRRTVS